jgi:hypothetical protein
VKRRTSATVRFITMVFLSMAVWPAAVARAQAPAGSGHTWILRVAGVSGAGACPCRSPVLNASRDRELYVVGLGFRQILHSRDHDGLELAYDFQFLPFILSRGTADGNLHVTLCQHGGYCGVSDSLYPWTTTAFGAGVLPLGLTGLVPVAPHVRLQLRGAAGVLRLSQPVPLMQGHKFNFTAEASTGVELRVSSKVFVTAGMVFNHISNGGTAQINPGMDSRLLEVGIVRR